MAKFKKGVSVDNTGTIKIDKSVEGVSDATKKAVGTRNANIAAGTPEKNVVGGAPSEKLPGEEASVVVSGVVRTDALQARINARNKANQVVPPADQSMIDTATGLPQGIEATKTEPTTTETTVPPVTTPTPTENAPEAPKKAEEVTPTPEEQAKLDEQAKQATLDKQKTEADTAAEAARQAEAAKKGETVVNTQDEAFAILQAGGTLPKSMKNAVFAERFRAYQKIAGMTSQAIADLNANGDISQSILDNLSKLNPEKYAEVVKLSDNSIKVNGINNTNERLYNKATGKKTEYESKSYEVLADIEATIKSDKPSIRGLREKYLTENKEIAQATKDLASKDAEIEEIQDAMDATYDEQRSLHPTLPKGMVMGMTAVLNKGLNDSLKTKIRERNILFADYQSKKEEANAMMNFEMQTVAEERADRAETLAFLQNKFNTFKSDEDWNRNKEFEKEKLAEAYRQQDEQAIKAHTRNLQILDIGQKFQSEESKKQRDQAMEIVKLQMKYAGTDSNIIQNEDGDYFQVTTDKITGKTTTTPINTKIEDEPIVYGVDGAPVAYEVDQNGNFTANFGQTGVVWTNSKGEVRDQCGMPVNDLTGLGVGNTYESKIAKTQEGRVAQVGDIFVSPRGEMYEGKNTGHIGMVKTILPNGDIEVWESNFATDKATGKGITGTRIIKKGSSYYNELAFGETKFSRNGAIDSAKSTKNEYFERAIDNLKTIKGPQWQGQDNVTGFENAVKRDGAGSPELKSYVNNLVGLKIGSDNWGAVGQAITGLEDIRKDITAYTEKYGDEGFGYVRNMSDKIAQLNASLGKGDIKPGTVEYERISMQSKILQSMQTYRKEKTGAAASELESKEYRELFPKWGDSSNVSLAKIDGLLSGIKSREKSEQMALLGGEKNYNYFINGNKQGQEPKEVSVASVVGDNNYSLSNANQKNFWNQTFGNDINSFTEFMFGNQ